MTRNQRKWWRGFLVEWGFQVRQILRLVGLVGISLLVAGGVMVLFYDRMVDTFMGSEIPLYLMPEDAEALASQLAGLRTLLLQWMGILAGVNLLLVIFVGVFITRKLGGPLYRFKQVMRRLADGDLTVEAQVRKKDEFRDLAEDISRAVIRLQMMVLAVREQVQQLRTVTVSEADQEKFAISLKALESALDYFHTVDLPSRDNSEESPAHPVAGKMNGSR